MTSYNQRDSYNRELPSRSEVPSDHANPSVPPATPRQAAPAYDNTAYRDGYLQGRVSEQRVSEADQVVRDNDNAARGLLVGMLFTALAGLVIGGIFILNQRSQTPVLIQRVAPSPAASPSPQVRDRIIERDRIVPVPQPQAPQVNVTVPGDSQPAAPVQPTQPNQTAPDATTNPPGSGAQPNTSTTGQ